MSRQRSGDMAGRRGQARRGQQRVAQGVGVGLAFDGQQGLQGYGAALDRLRQQPADDARPGEHLRDQASVEGVVRIVAGPVAGCEALPDGERGVLAQAASARRRRWRRRG